MLKTKTQEYIRAFGAKDLEAISELLAPNFALEDPVVKRLEGKEACLEMMKNLFSSCQELSFCAKQIYQDGQSTLIEFVLILDNKRLEGVDVIEWRDGKMHELRAYLDIPKD